MIDRFRGDYRFLSNFYLSPIEMDDLLFPSVENAYQASKTLDMETRAEFEGLFPGEAKRRGRELKLRSDWESMKLAIMEALLRQKFAIPRLKKKLLATGTEELVEGNDWGDTFWGVCEGKGENHLGKLLMKIRAECA